MLINCKHCHIPLIHIERGGKRAVQIMNERVYDVMICPQCRSSFYTNERRYGNALPPHDSPVNGPTDCLNS